MLHALEDEHDAGYHEWIIEVAPGINQAIGCILVRAAIIELESCQHLIKIPLIELDGLLLVFE